MASVEFEQVDKIYPDGTQAVREFDLRVADGEMLVMVGPSGCGKSTVLRLLAGLEEITRGTLRIAGGIVNGLRPQDRNVAMVFQDYALYPYLSVRGNLEFPLKMRSIPPAERQRRIAWVTQMLSLDGLLERLPKELSGGQRQRVAMGRALVREPTVFLLDEPLSNLDAKLRGQVRAEIGDLQRRTGTTMLYVTHDQVEAMTLGDRVAVLDRGRLQQVAPPRILYECPANAFVAGFIGNPPMNLFPSRVCDGAQGRASLAVGDQWVDWGRPDCAAPPWRTLWNRPVTAGLRPEAMSLVDSGGLVAEVLDVEYLGHEALLRVGLAATPPAASVSLIVRLGGMRRFERGATLRLELDPRQIYLFDSDHGALLIGPFHDDHA
ncbi:MAG: ABC transporter ATP-binding protein [Gammaproteobacteria bacterium]|nr:ABC transporter ATP-binding protein [Gammaproteobacteria bacterium]MCP5425598.1 ABC transporter ATP-binding protein [Gammaproteobacteria bacterium]MCP5459002.1 ABC transporter ATP-binding protein [Gammaproteobacteria bacterium]